MSYLPETNYDKKITSTRKLCQTVPAGTSTQVLSVTSELNEYVTYFVPISDKALLIQINVRSTPRLQIKNMTIK